VSGPKHTAWHSGAVAGFNSMRAAREPREGWYKVQFVENGPWAPVAIWWDEATDHLMATESGSPTDPWHLWRFCVPIPKSQFDALTKSQLQNPDMAATHVPLNLSALPARPQRKTMP